MKLNELDAGGETPPDIISDVDDIQQGFDVAKFTEMIGDIRLRKRNISLMQKKYCKKYHQAIRN